MSFPKYESYRDSGVEWIGEVPSHWEVLSVKRVGNIRYGIGEPPQYVEEGTPLIRATNIDSGRILEKGLVFVDPADIPEQRIIWLRPGDIIVVRSGANTGDSAMVRNQNCPSIAGFDMVFRPKSCNPDLLQYIFLSSEIKDAQIGLVKLRAAQPHLNAEELGACSITIGTPLEQKKIAAFLDRETAKIDALVEAQRQLIELLKEKRQAVISHAVTKGLDPTVPMKDSGVEWLGEVPAHWDVRSLKRDIIYITSGSRGWAGNYSDGGDLFIRIGNLTRDSLDLDFADVQRVKVPEGIEGERTRVQPGDVLFSITAYLGSVAVVPIDIGPAYVSQHVALVRLRPGRLLPQWVGAVASSGVGQAQLAAQGFGGTKVQLGLDDVSNLTLTVPPEDEQRTILEWITSRDAKFRALSAEAESAIALLQERRAALIAAAVTGKIDVRGLVPAAGAEDAA